MYWSFSNNSSHSILIRKHVSRSMFGTYFWITSVIPQICAKHATWDMYPTRMELTVVLTSGWFLCHFNSQETDTNLNHQHLPWPHTRALFACASCIYAIRSHRGFWYCPSTFAWYIISICNKLTACIKVHTLFMHGSTLLLCVHWYSAPAVS